MKKILPILLLGAVAFTSCENEMEDVFGQSAAERLNATQAKYSALLTSSPYGWAFEYYPTSSADDGAVLYALRFEKDGSVDIAGDPFGTGVINHEVSCWDIITDNGPVLSFSTYNELIHQFSDPRNDGSGYEGDYEFSFVYSDTENPDSVIMLKGKKRGLYSRLKMIDEDVTPAEYLTDCTNKMAEIFPESAKNYVILHIGNDEVRMDNMSTGTPEYYLYGKDKILFAKINSYIFTKYTGHYYARFNQPFKSTNGRATEKNFIYDETAQELVGIDDPSVKITAPHFATFFVDETVGRDAITEQWRITRNSEMSEKFAEVWQAAMSAMSKKNNTLNECVLSATNSGEGNNITISLKYKPKTGAAREVYYKFNMTREGDVVTLEYVEPFNDGASTILANIPACETLIKAFEGKYTVDNTNDIKLIINALKLTGVDNGMAFAMTAKYNNNSATN